MTIKTHPVLELLAVLAVAVLLHIPAFSSELSLDDLKSYASNERRTAASSQSELYLETFKQMSYEFMKLEQTRFKLSLIEKEELQSTLELEYRIQVEYYGISAGLKRLELAESGAKLVEKQFLVETEMLERGYSTQVNVNEAMGRHKQAKNRADELLRGITEGKSSLSALLKDGKEIDLELDDLMFDIPNGVEIGDEISLDELIEACRQSNIELMTARNDAVLLENITENLLMSAGEDDTSYKSAFIEMDKAFERADALTRKIEAGAEIKYNTYVKCLADYNAGLEMKTVWEQKLSSIEAVYTIGAISELEYLSEKIAAEETLLNISLNAIALINAKSALELAYNGIL